VACSAKSELEHVELGRSTEVQVQVSFLTFFSLEVCRVRWSGMSRMGEEFEEEEEERCLITGLFLTPIRMYIFIF
jgi:hypothetical protein